MATLNQPHLRWGFIVLFAISGVALLGNRTQVLNSATNQLETAKEKWTTQAVSHYRLSIDYNSLLNCQQEVEVKDEKVISVKKNTCSTTPPPTVSELFEQIESLADGKECGPNGCVCDGPVGVNAVYDSQFGYPRQLEIKLQPEKRWLYYDSWQDIYPGRPCTLIGFINKKITVRAFIPVPKNSTVNEL